MLKTLSLGVVLLTCILACSSSKTRTKEISRPLSFWINQECVDAREGLRLSLVHSFPQPYLGIAVHDTTLVQQLAQAGALQMMLARGNRSLTSFRENYEVPYRMGFDVTRLLEKAKPGDRLVFVLEEADQILYTLPLIP